MHAGTAHGINTQAQSRTLDGIEVDDVRKIADVGIKVVVLVGAGGAACALHRYARDPLEFRREERIRRFLYPRRDLGVGGTAVWRVVLEAAAVGRIMRGRNDDAVGNVRLATVVMHQDRKRNRWSRRVFAALRDHDLNAVGRKHFKRAVQCGPRQGMRIDADEERPVDALLLAVAADRLADRKDVRFIESAVERSPAMP